jgi:hypothetical protein
MSGPAYTNLRNAAQVKALNSISDQKAGIGEDLATFAQTVELFRGNATSLYDILKAFKEDRLMRNLRRLSYKDILALGSRKTANRYLEYVYGWKPLVSDVYGVYQLLKEYGNGNKPIILHGHGSVKQSDTKFYQYKFAGWQAGNHWYTRTTNETVKSKCDLYARIDSSVAPLRALNQLGLLNPTSIAWEIVPWSFVVDWLIPIGPWLNSLSAKVGLNFVSGTSSERISRTHEGEWHTVPLSNSSNILEDRPLPFTVIDELYNRQALTSWPTPLPYVNLTPLSGDRPFKALALLIANLKR